MVVAVVEVVTLYLTVPVIVQYAANLDIKHTIVLIEISFATNAKNMDIQKPSVHG